MASKHPFSDGPWYCKHCQKAFTVWEDLVDHKKRMRSDKKEDHIHCKFCGRDFRTLEGEMKHMQVYHPMEQNIDCPGCGQGPFTRLSTLMSHIERGHCTRLSSTVLDQLREEKLEFPRQLEKLTNEAIKGNYMKYMPSANAKNQVSGFYVEKEVPSFKMDPDEFPDLSTTAADSTQPTCGNASEEPKSSHGSRGSEKSFKNSFQLPFRPANNAKTAPASSSEKKPQISLELPLRLLSDTNRTKSAETPSSVQRPQPAFESGVTTVGRNMNLDDPNSPSFNVARYRCPITEKFNCPKPLCGKVFKTAKALIGHLRGPTHGSTTYRCPSCLKIFKTLQGISSHAEARGAKCRLQDTVHYETYMDQLTAGIVDVERTRYQDGSIIFKTSEEAKKKLRGEVVDEKDDKAKYTTDAGPDKVYW